MLTDTAPRSYRDVQQIYFCIEDTQIIRRKYGVWVEGGLTDTQSRKLKERQIQKTITRVANTLPQDVEPDVLSEVYGYLEKDWQQCSQAASDMASGDPLPAVIE